jgi:hypothetical protein
MKKYIGITGHGNIETPFNLFYNPNQYDSDLFIKVFNDINSFFKNEQEPVFVSGMARGIDEIFALVAIHNNFDLVLCVPESTEWHKNLPIKETRPQAINYDFILNYNNIIQIHETKRILGQNVFNNRNTDIINISDDIYSYHLFESIGTMDCINKAIKENKYRGNIFTKLN